MNTNDIRKVIKNKIAEEKRTNELKSQIVASAGKKAAAKTIKFVENYVSLTPDLMDKVYLAAQQQNLLNQFQPIFDVVFNYWSEEFDYIPDHLGLAGICDDAYMSLSLMNLIANTEIQGTGRLVLELDLRGMNNDMSVLLGPNITTQLDVTVTATYQSATIQNSLSALMNVVAGGIAFGTPFSGMQNMIDQYRIKESVNTQLGAMGIF